MLLDINKQSTCVIESGLSDFHKIIVSVLKMLLRKLPLRIISYSDFCNYENANFINSLNELLCENENAESFLKDLDYFCKVCTKVLNKHAPCQKKHVRENNKPFMTKRFLLL